MATIKPFAALRPNPELAARVCELPYDVFSTEEARQAALGNPLSFLHVSKPEIDLPPSTDPYAPEVYAKGRANFRRFISDGVLRRDASPCFYIYRQTVNGRAQTGLVAAASCEEYLQGLIRKHELTRPDKEDDRVRHIETLEAQTGPAFLVYRAEPELDSLLASRAEQPPAIDFTAADGVRHSAWVIDSPGDMRRIQEIFHRMPRLYIADGHHRSAAAGRVYQARRTPETAAFLSVIFPHDQLRILPYNRAIQDLNGLSAAQLLEKLDGMFAITTPGAPSPAKKHELGLYLEGRWHTLAFRPRFTATQDAIEKLDVTLLQKHVLDPILGIENPRTSQRIAFIGGIRGTRELETLVDAGKYACAFSLFPTSIEDLMTIADANGIMPPKSTWFEPKLRDAMFSLQLEPGVLP
jgi:uncharacterized protein (DUF1015 family)